MLEVEEERVEHGPSSKAHGLTPAPVNFKPRSLIALTFIRTQPVPPFSPPLSLLGPKSANNCLQGSLVSLTPLSCFSNILEPLAWAFSNYETPIEGVLFVI
jgi:hypothetical protein